MTYELLRDKIAYIIVIPFILISISLSINYSGALVEKSLISIFMILCLFIYFKDIPSRYFYISFSFFSMFMLLGFIHYLRYYELSHISLPIVFLMTFYIGLIFPYKNNFLLICTSVFISLYLSYLYVSNFQINVLNNRFAAEGFDINYLGFIYNFLFLIVIFYLKENRKNLVMYILILLIFVLGLITSSRGTLIGFLFGISLFLYGENKKTKLSFIIFILTIGIIYTIFNYEMIIAILERFTNPAQRDKLVNYAMVFYFSGDLFNQLFGTWGGAYQNFSGYVTHNDQLRILISYGFLTLILYIIMYVCIIFNILSFNKYLNKKDKIYSYFILMMILMYLFRGNFSNFFPSIFIFYFIGSFYGMKYNIEKKELFIE